MLTNTVLALSSIEAVFGLRDSLNLTFFEETQACEAVLCTRNDQMQIHDYDLKFVFTICGPDGRSLDCGSTALAYERVSSD